jgi:hypothetical protein
MRDQIEHLAQTLSARVAALTNRERALAAIAALVAATWCAVSAAGLVDASRTRLLEAQSLFRAPQTHQGLAGDARNARAWAIVANDNIAELRALALVEEAAQTAGLRDLTVSVAPSSTAGRILIVLDAAFERESFGALLAALGAAEESLTPVELEVDQVRGRLRTSVAAVHLSTREAP